MNDFGLIEVVSGEMIALRGVDASTRIAGLLAVTILTQKYRNDRQDNLELAYTFPLPLGATLLSFTVQVGERKCHGEVIPRREAEVAYETAVAEGNSAFRLQEIQPGMYCATLGNVMAGESVEINLSYAETLAWNGKSIRYRLPTTIAPRYGEPQGMQPWQRPITSLSPEYPLSLEVTIVGALAQSAIACPSHKVGFKPSQEALLITLASGATLDRDFVLEIDNESVQSLGISASARDTHVAIVTLLPPEVENVGNDRDTMLVIDCSGSMQGDSLALAKEGLQLALASLQPTDRFGILGFGTRFVHFDKALQPANRKNLDLARRFVDGLGGLGGTELSQALELALAYSSGRPMDILLLTDGETWDLGDAVAKAKEKGIRIFTVGIGSAVAEDTVRTLADQTGGACELVSPHENMSARIYRHFNRMRQPQMSRLEIQWPVETIWESRPDRGCFAGDSYTVAAAFVESVASSVPVVFEFQGTQPAVLDIPLVSAGEISDAVVRVAARQQLAQVPAPDQQNWAVRYQLVTDRTDYLIRVERSADDKAEALPELQLIPQMLPAGWGGTSTVMEPGSPYPGTSSASAAPEVLFSISRSRSYNDIADVPAVVRKRNVTVEALMGAKDNGYSRLIKELNSRAGRRLFGGLPRTVEELIRLPLPATLQTLLYELLKEHPVEEDIVRAFYQAVFDHDGSAALSAKLLQKAKAIIGDQEADPILVVRWSHTLKQLRDERTAGGGVDRYDIPAFLRKEAD